MTDGERLALDIIRNVRAALGTPDEMHVEHHAAQVAAELQRAREDLAQARAMLQQAHEELQVAQIDATKWRAVPWQWIFEISILDNCDATKHDLWMWYKANKPQEVRA